MASEAPLTTFVVDNRLPWPDEDGVHPKDGSALERGTIWDGQNPVACAFAKIARGGATVASDFVGRQGSSIAVQLDSGQRRGATVEWARSGRMGIRFDEPLDVIALINRTLIAQPAERRKMPRVEVRCPVHVKWCEHLEPAVLRNISSSGLQLEGPILPPMGTLVSLYVEGINLPPSESVWRQRDLAGFEFFEEVSWSSIIAWVREIGRAIP